MFDNKRFKKWVSIALSLAVCFWAIACDSIANNAEEKIRLTVGLDPTFPPFEMREESDRIVGFDLDLLQAIAEQEEIEIEIDANFAFNQLITALETGEIDAIASGMVITSKRAEKVSFSRPYFRSELAIAVRDEERRVTSINNLNNKTIAVQIGTKGARKAESIPGAKISQFSSISLALQELKNSNVDAVIHDIPAILYAVKIANLDGLKIIGDLSPAEYYGIALPKNSEYIDLINDALEELIVNRTYENLYRQWFNSEPPPLSEIAPALE